MPLDQPDLSAVRGWFLLLRNYISEAHQIITLCQREDNCLSQFEWNNGSLKANFHECSNEHPSHMYHRFGFHENPWETCITEIKCASPGLISVQVIGNHLRPNKRLYEISMHSLI